MASYIKAPEDANDSTTSEPEQRREQKLPDAVIKRREQARLLGILDSDDENESTSVPVTERKGSERRRNGHAKSQSSIAGTTMYLLQKLRILLFWIGTANNANNPFPSSTKLALDIYSIPAMSSECERVFSETKRVITDERNQLKDTTIEAIQCQRNWLTNKVVYSDLDLVLKEWLVSRVKQKVKRDGTTVSGKVKVRTVANL